MKGLLGSKDRMGPWLERALNLSYQRQNALSGNIANADTPGYKPIDLDFRAQLAKEITGAGGAPMKLEAAERPSASGPSLDGNHVDLDTEVMAMNANRLFYDLASETTTRRLAMLRYAIDEGGR